MTSMKTLESRALSAYLRIGEGVAIQPSEPVVDTVDGREYVVLYNTAELLAVYRVQNRGQLKRLKRWPSEITEAYGS